MTPKKIAVFLLIFVLVVYLSERRKTGPLPAPAIEILTEELRQTEGIDFSLRDVANQIVETKELRGAVLLLNFFQTWCPPCRKEMPSLEALYQRYKDEGLIVIGIAGDEQGLKVVKPFAEEFAMTFPVLIDSNHHVTDQYNVRQIPAVFLLDRQGRLAGKLVGGADWSSEVAYAHIETLLHEHS